MKSDPEMKTAVNPQMTILRTGSCFKVLQVAGSEGMCMHEHSSTKEAVIIVQKGSAILKMGEKEYSLNQNQSFIIPGRVSHMLRIEEAFQAIVVMDIDSEIKFVNQ